MLVEKLSLQSPQKPRVRFAPSPTGYLHIGGARTCLFNFLFARKEGGSLILRIEDTDRERSKKEFEEDILESLRWLGISWDEGPDIGGKYGPYRQSERTEIYQGYIEKLLQENKAYYCFCSPEELEAERQYRLSQGLPPVYSGKCASISLEEAKERIKKGEKAIIRFRNPGGKIKIKDLVRGEIEFDTSLLGDFTIAKSETEPLYNLANVIDDHEMRITHVIRGEEHISNTPKQILLQKALGFSVPQYAHLPLILAPDKTKLSKRHGAVAVRDFKEEGYLPEALVNFIALLGWHPPEDKEIFSLEELIQRFSLSRVRKSGAIFNLEKLRSFNGYYIRSLEKRDFTFRVLPFLEKEDLLKAEIIEKERGEIVGVFGKEIGLKIIMPHRKGEEIGVEKLSEILGLFQERVKTLKEVPEQARFFFVEEIELNPELLRWKEASYEKTLQALEKALQVIQEIPLENWNIENIKERWLRAAEEFNSTNRGYLLWPTRVALTGMSGSPPPFEIAYYLGKEETIKRLERAIQLLNSVLR